MLVVVLVLAPHRSGRDHCSTPTSLRVIRRMAAACNALANQCNMTTCTMVELVE